MIVSDPKVVTEPRILRASIDWLFDRDILPYRFSISGGTREERESLKANIRDWYSTASKSLEKPFLPEISQGGPDIEARSLKSARGSPLEWWRIESKGTGLKGTESDPNTLRNYFIRALGSVVSYYTDQTQKIGPHLENKTLFLGLALPDIDIYMNELQSRVRKPLRRQLNLWILLYEIGTARIRPIAPDEDVV